MDWKSLYYYWYVNFVFWVINTNEFWIGVFIFANVVNSFLTNVGKVIVGGLRPHFIPSCFNQYTYQAFCKDPTVWITNYTCIGEASTVLKEKDGAYDIR